VPDGNDSGLALSQLPDGDYDILVETNVASFSPGVGTECTVSDSFEELTFTRSGDSIQIWPQCTCEEGDLICDDGTVTSNAPECRPIPPGSYVAPCAWTDEGEPGMCIFASGRTLNRILEDFDVGRIGSVSVSPDAEQIVFGVEPVDGSESVLYIANADGTDPIALPRLCNDGQAAWSPNGEWLAFHSCGDLALMRPDGTEQEPILVSSETGPCFQGPQWSPDSQSIVAVVWPDQECGEPTYPLAVEIWVISLDGETTLPVANFIVEETSECMRSGIAFSPDGTQVAYQDNECSTWLINADGSGGPESLDEFPYNWRGDHYPQWAEAGE
jgi:Tol biopolymer transport system component